MNEIILGSLDKLEQIEKKLGVTGSVVAVITLVVVTVIVGVGIYSLLKIWLHALEILVPMILDGWTL